MLEQNINIWSAPNAYARCITTNGVVKQDGCAVMGKGIALQAKELFPGIDKILGDCIKHDGNRTNWTMNYKPERLIFFPTKHHYYDKSDIKLIELSARQLVDMIPMKELFDWSILKVYLPRPGCNNGGLKWKDVKLVIEPILDDRFVVTHWEVI